MLAASLFAASKRSEDGLSNLFSRARVAGALAPAVVMWLNGGGLTLYDALPPGTGFDFVGYRKGMLSGARVVGVAVKNDATEIDAALEGMKTFARYTEAMHLACTPAVAAEYLAARAAATGRWDAEALLRRLRSLGVGLLIVEGDAISQTLLAKTRPLDGKALEALVAAFRNPR